MAFDITVSGGIAKIVTPYNANFVAKIKMIGGAKWDAGSRCWTVPDTAEQAVRDVMRQVYGRDDLVEGETVSVRLTFAESCVAVTGPVTIMGHTISRAYGRDSGARPGDDVSFVRGGCKSGGSVANWQSIVEADSVVILGKVSLSMYEAESKSLPRGVTCEIIDSTQMVNRASLEAEKARLLARIAEIDKMLAEMGAENG